MSMQVTINALQYKRNSSGIGVLLRELFGRLGSELPCRVVLPRDCPPFPVPPGCELVAAPFSNEQGLRRVLFQTFALGPGYCKNAVVLTTDSKVPLVLPGSAKLISVITDLAVFRMSEVYQGSRALLWKLQYRYLCKRANGYIAISEFTKRELVDVLGIPADKIEVVPCAAPEGMGRVEDPGKLEACRGKLLLRDSEISNSAEVIRRLGVIAMNTAVEVDLYGNVNSSQMNGTNVYNGIGGSGDYARNAAISIFMTNSVAKNGKISSIVPMVSHVDHTEHDVDVIVTEQGWADLRGLSPKQRAVNIIENCAHPDYREQLRAYFEDACAATRGAQTPHLLDRCFAFHRQLKETGSMRMDEEK